MDVYLLVAATLFVCGISGHFHTCCVILLCEIQILMEIYILVSIVSFKDTTIPQIVYDSDIR